jgi:alpha-mannosidase
VRGFAIWLFGLSAKRPLQYRRLRRVRASIHRTVARLDAEVVRSAEPIPFAELDRSAFRRIRRGASYGRTLDCAWLRITGEVPPGAEDAVVLLGVRGEGLVHAADGTILDAISTVYQQGDLPHAGGRYREVRGVDLSPGRVELYADVAWNGWLLYPVGRGRYDGAVLAVRDGEAYGLYYDYLTLLVLADATDDAALAAELWRALDAAWARFRGGDVPGARAALTGALGQASGSDFVYSAIGHGHLDMAWLWPLRETRRKAARTYARQLGNVAERPGYVYGTSQPQQLWWMKQEHPALFARLRDAVAAGRIETQGSFWVETDTNMPGGESLVRQALVGRRFWQEEFGIADDDLRLCWLPDTFGYSGNLPQILTKTGMDWFQTIKLAWNKVTVFPHRTFRWQGIDGSEVLVHMPPEGDYNSRAAADGLLKGLARYPERALGTALLVFGSGDGGGGPGEVHLELTAREHTLRGLPRVEYRMARDFFRDLERRAATGHAVEHTHRGELYLEAHQGTYTTQAEIKRRNRLVERRLHEAEALAALVGDDAAPRLEPLWRRFLLHHFHDILPGSSIGRVNREAVEELGRIESELDDDATGLVARLPHEGAAPAAINLTSFDRDEHVQAGGRWYRARVAPYAAAALEEAGEHPELTIDGDTIGNGILTLRFGPTGEIVSCVDADGAEHARDGLNRLVLHRDPYQWPWDAWDIGMGYLNRHPDVLVPVEASTTIEGPTIVRRQRYRWRRGEIEQRVILEAGSELVRFDTRIGWRERHRMLRADFRPARYGDTVRCEIQFGHIERTTTERDDVERAQFEVCAHKWVAVEEEAGGFALLNDAKYGHRAKSGLLSLDLLRAPTFPDRTADRGEHRFTYAFRPFAAGGLGDVIRDGYRLNNPLRVEPGVAFPSAAAADDPGVVIETVKPAERGGAVVLRLYESLGRATTTRVRVAIPHGAAHEADLLERRTGPADLDRLAFTPFEIKTIVLERA